VSAGNHTAYLTARIVGRPKSGYLDDINGHKETEYKNVVQKDLDTEDWRNSCGKLYSFDCAWVIVMMIWQEVEKYENSHIFPYDRINACHCYDYILYIQRTS
jgi:hypothetical protein